MQCLHLYLLLVVNNTVNGNSVNGKSMNNMENNATLPNNNGNDDNMFNNGVNDDQLINDYSMNSTRAHEPNEIMLHTPRKRKTISFSTKDNTN